MPTSDSERFGARTYDKADGPQAILDRFRREVAEATGQLRRVTTNDELPVEHRRRIRNESVATVERIVNDARRAVVESARDTATAARKRFAEDPVGTAAEETRRNTRELRLARLVESAKARDARLGPQVIDLGMGEKRIVANVTAHEYADRAEALYLDGRYEDAQLYAAASTEMGGPEKAQRMFNVSQDALDAANPVRAEALREIATAERTVKVFDKYGYAALAETYQSGAEAARAVGDDWRSLAQKATAPSMSAKWLAASLAQESGEAYSEPAGVMKMPTGSMRMTATGVG